MIEEKYYDDVNNAYYYEWLNDNIEDLKRLFIEENKEDFDYLCKQEYKIYKECD
jgi:hypothetical protein